jgi:hypothetical protein
MPCATASARWSSGCPRCGDADRRTWRWLQVVQIGAGAFQLFVDGTPIGRLAVHGHGVIISESLPKAAESSAPSPVAKRSQVERGQDQTGPASFRRVSRHRNAGAAEPDGRKMS